MGNPRVIFIAITLALLVLGVWQEIRLVKATLAKRRYLHVASQLLILGSVDLLSIFFVSYMLGMLAPALGGLSSPKYMRLAFCGILLGITVAGAGQWIIEGRQSFIQSKYLRSAALLGLAILAMVAAGWIYLRYLRG